MLVTHRKMDICLTVAGSIHGTFYQMFLHRRTRSVAISVEQEQSLRQLTVVQSFLFKHIGYHLFIFPGSHERFDILTLILLAYLIEGTVECESLNIVKVLFLKIRCRHIIVGTEESEQIREHSAGCPTGRYELHECVTCCLIVVPYINVLFSVCVSHT